MNDQSANISITIGQTTHHIDPNDKASIVKIPWQDRKKIITVIELIKQAEHVNAPAVDKQLEVKAPSIQKRSTQEQLNPQFNIKPNDVDFNPTKKSLSDNEADLIMQQMIMAEKPSSKILEKKDIYKWLLIVLVVIVVLAFIF